MSLVPVIENPTSLWKTAVFSQLKRNPNIDGHTIRTAQYRYTEWDNSERGRELYDYSTDPNETVNTVDLPENAELVAHLREQLSAGWQAAFA